MFYNCVIVFIKGEIWNIYGIFLNNIVVLGVIYIKIKFGFKLGEKINWRRKNLWRNELGRYIWKMNYKCYFVGVKMVNCVVMGCCDIW